MLLLINEKSEFFPNDLKILLDILNSNCSPEVYYQLLQIDLESLLIAQQICHSHFRPGVYNEMKHYTICINPFSNHTKPLNTEFIHLLRVILTKY